MLNIIKENKIKPKSKLLSITNSYIVKLIFRYLNVSNTLKIIKQNKSLQKKIGLSLSSYQIFSYYKKNKINMFDFQKLIRFSHNIKSKLKDYSTLDEIYYGLSICILDNFYTNDNIRNKNANIIDLNMLYGDLYLIYSSLLLNFSSSFKINLFYSDKFFIDQIYREKYYQNFVKKNINFINGISLEIYDKNIIKSITDNKYIFNNKSLKATYNINRIKFSKIKFCKDEMKLMQFFTPQNINEICFISCKLTLFSIEVLSNYFSKEENYLKNLIFNDCHIYDHLIEKLIYWDDKNIEYSYIKSILRKLEKLDLSSNNIKDLGFYRLLFFFNSNNKLCEQKLVYLDLSHNKLTSKSIKYLLNIENESNIFNNNNKMQLMIKGIGIGIGQTEKLKGLIYLDLSHNCLGNSAKLIFSWKNNSITHLILNDCNIRINTKENYVSRFKYIDEEDENNDETNSYSKKDETKFEDDDNYDEENIKPGLNNLLYLSISKNQISSKFVKYMFYEFINLNTIILSSCFLDNNSFDDIINTNKKVNFKKLIMCHNYIETKTIIELYENDIISNVEELNLFDNNLQDAIVQYLINKKENIKLKKINIDLNYGIEKDKACLLYKNFIKYSK